MSLKSIIQKKDAHFQAMLNKFDTEFRKLSADAQKMIVALFRNGDYSAESLAQAMAGYDDLINEWAVRNQEAIKYTKMMADELGMSFVITKEAVKNFDTIQSINAENLSKNITSYIADMRKFGVSYKLEGKGLSEITKGLESKFEELGRRLNTEAYTGIRMADASVKQDFFKKAGITKYYYDGPNDSKTRDVCANTLSDPRQADGWTLKEVNTSDTPFIERGGFNCRHEWLPFVEGLNASV